MTLPALTHYTAIEHALGGGILIRSAREITPAIVEQLRACVDEIEATLSRFRPDSLVSQLSRASQGVCVEFPQWCEPLFAYNDVLCAATDSRFDPCVGADLQRLGYAQSFEMVGSGDGDGDGDAVLGGAAELRRASWHRDIERRGSHGTTLCTTRAIQLDFGATAKGFCVDCMAQILAEAGIAEFVIDAGGDLYSSLSEPIAVAMENPHDFSQAIGVIKATRGAVCASAPSRRNWADASERRAHHLLNAATGESVHEIAASWACVPAACSYPVMIADGLATALFTTNPNDLRAQLPAELLFSCAVLDSADRVMISLNFNGEVFV